MDLTTLNDEELAELGQQVALETDNRRAAASAPMVIQQTALRAMAVGASAQSLQDALDVVINPQEVIPPAEEPVVEESTPEPPVEDVETPETTEVVPEPESSE